MDNRLEKRLIDVQRRIGHLNLVLGTSCVFLVSSVIALLLSFGVRASVIEKTSAIPFWAVASGIGLLCVFAKSLGQPLNRRSLIGKIESRFPDLKQALLTASQTASTQSAPSGYLEQALISDALQHDAKHPWRSIVSAKKLQIAHIANGLALLVACLACLRMLNSETQRTIKYEATTAPWLNTNIEVLPGDVEVERGSNLIITAKFGDNIPEEVELIQIPTAEASRAKGESGEHVLKMKRNLSDPIFARFLPAIEESFVYKIRFSQQSTDAFRIKVFEYPELVRADVLIQTPVYAGQRERNVIDTRRVSIPQGSRLTWTLFFNKPIADISIDEASQTTPSKNAPAFAGEPRFNDDKTQIQFSVAPEQSTSWLIQLSDKKERQNKEAIRLRALVLPNKPPAIKLVDGGDATVSALEEFPIAAKIQDDYGLQRVGLTYEIDGEEVSTPFASPQKAMQINQLIEFEELNAKPGQLLTYHFWAEDQDVSGKARRTVSDLYFVEVREFLEFFRESDPNASSSQSQQQNQNPQGMEEIGNLIENQRRIVVAGWKLQQQAPSKNVQKDASTLADSQRQGIELLSKLSEQLASQEGAKPDPELISEIREMMQDAAESFELSAADPMESEALGKGTKIARKVAQALLQLESKEHRIQRSQQQQNSSQSRRSSARQRQIDELKLDSEKPQYANERLAQTEQEQQEAEARQISNRLKELSNRQEDINEQLKEINAALELATTKSEQEELQRQLKRLREEQQRLLENADEVLERMNQQETMQDQQEQMQTTRDQMQRAAEALSQQQTGQALAQGTRANESLENLEDQIRQQTSGAFTRDVQSMQNDVRELIEQQKELEVQLENETDQSTAPSSSANRQLREPENNKSDELSKIANRQTEQTRDLMERLQQTIQEAEETEPLLAQKLYDGYRQAEQLHTEERLDVARQLIDRNLLKDAQQLASESVQDLEQLGEKIDQAASSVLGSQRRALEQAIKQLDRLNSALDGEIANASEPSDAGRTTGRFKFVCRRNKSATIQRAGPQQLRCFTTIATKQRFKKPTSKSCATIKRQS